MSLIAKVNVVNTLIASLFVYKMTVLPRMSEKTLIKKLESIISSFIWSNKKAKIARGLLQSSKQSGGLGLVDLRKKDDALKISWIAILRQDQKYANLVYKLIHQDLEENVWQCNICESDVKFVTKNPFWADVLRVWSKINYKDELSKSQVIWLNSMIKINGKTHFLERGISERSNVCKSDCYRQWCYSY